MPGTITCLIGSTSHGPLFRYLEKELSYKGEIVLSPLVYNQSGDNPECGFDKKRVLDETTLMKIEICDRVIVVDGLSGYIDESTTNQIIYAQYLGKPILYYSKNEVKI